MKAFYCLSNEECCNREVIIRKNIPDDFHKDIEKLYLTIYSSSKNNNIEFIKDLHNLKCLGITYIDFSKRNPFELSDVINELTNLEILDLNNLSLKNVKIDKLINLRQLSIHFCNNLINYNSNTFKKLTKLKYLVITKTYVNQNDYVLKSILGIKFEVDFVKQKIIKHKRIYNLYEMKSSIICSKCKHQIDIHNIFNIRLFDNLNNFFINSCC